jgi:hypothetical protein
MSGLKPEPISEARSKARSRSLRDNSQKGNGKGEKQIPKGNDRKKSKGNGKSEYRGPSLRSRMTSVVGGNRKRAPRLVGALRVFGRAGYWISAPFSLGSLGSSGGITVALATLSSVSRFRRRTPLVLRPALRTDFVSMRMILPNWLMTIISVVSSTRLMAVTLPILEPVFMLMTPLPPRVWRR